MMLAEKMYRQMTEVILDILPDEGGVPMISPQAMRRIEDMTYRYVVELEDLGVVHAGAVVSPSTCFEDPEMGDAVEDGAFAMACEIAGFTALEELHPLVKRATQATLAAHAFRLHPQKGLGRFVMWVPVEEKADA